MKKKNSHYLSSLIQKRCDLYSQVAEHLLEIEEAIEHHHLTGILESFEKIRRIIRTSLPFLTDQIFYELERLEALILPHKNQLALLPLDTLKTRFAILHVQFSKALKSPEAQDMEEILSLPKEIRDQIKTSEKEFQEVKEKAQKVEKAAHYAKEAEKYAGEKNFKKALKSFKKALEFCPDQAVYHNDLGVIYTYLGMLDQAREEYKSAIDLNEKNPQQRTEQWTLTYFNLGKIYQRLGDKFLDKPKPNENLLEKAKGEYTLAIQALEEFLKHSTPGEKREMASQHISLLQKEISILEKTLGKLTALKEKDRASEQDELAEDELAEDVFAEDVFAEKEFPKKELPKEKLKEKK